MTESFGVLLCLEGALEEELVRKLASGPIYVERRCADLVELLACSSAGLGELALISLEMENVDRATVTALHRAGVKVVLACAPGDEARAADLADAFVPLDASAGACVEVLEHLVRGDDVAPLAALLTAPVPAGPEGLLDSTDPMDPGPGGPAQGERGQRGQAPLSGPGQAVPAAQGGALAALPQSDATATAVLPSPLEAAAPAASAEALAAPVASAPVPGTAPAFGASPFGAPGQAALDTGYLETEGGGGSDLIAVWSGPGSPGRTVLAVEVAAECAAQGWNTLLVDADTLGPCLSQSLGFLEETSALAVACRYAAHGRLDAKTLTELAANVSTRLDLLAGLTRADRWRELPSSALEEVWRAAREAYDVVVVDLSGALLDPGATNAYGPVRDDATISALEAASAVLLVGAADPVSMRRLVGASGELEELHLTSGRVVLAVNRAPAQRRAVDEALAVAARYTGRSVIVPVPRADDQLATALLHGRPARSPKTEFSGAVAKLTALLLEERVREKKRLAHRKAQQERAK
ncbi:hypothetical protein ABYF32_05405 [Buchananella felis]|uniref:AAA family ATPase n=1 Tax=Buchananella felis TaxID=3231492 RepID=UPI0035271999